MQDITSDSLLVEGQQNVMLFKIQAAKLPMKKACFNQKCIQYFRKANWAQKILEGFQIVDVRGLNGPWNFGLLRALTLCILCLSFFVSLI